VYTSSVATLGFGAGSNVNGVADEASPVCLADMIGHYKRSKFMAERVVLDAARAGANVVMVNPTAPIGEQDIKPTPTGRIVLDFLKGKFPAYVETGLNLVDVRDVAHAHIVAFEKAKPGELYILGGENMTLKQVLDKLSEISGVPSPTVKLPYAIAFVSGMFDTFFTGMLFRKEPRVTLDAVRMGKKKMWASSEKAERDLGWKSAPVDGALRRAADWFTANGYVSARHHRRRPNRSRASSARLEAFPRYRPAARRRYFRSRGCCRCHRRHGANRRTRRRGCCLQALR
jgi:dihydroflavonol-4-reductase